jgi:16S rRNA (cytosine1402-N4)-methyltransferase
MRMDPTTGTTAAEVVNGYDGKRLAKVLKEYGDERFASRIADAIVRERAREPFTRTARLAELVRDAIPQRPAGPADTPQSARSRPCGSK